jgi:hypothetical protein
MVRKPANSAFHNRRHGVWVPAFAGTTMEFLTVHASLKRWARFALRTRPPYARTAVNPGTAANPALLA